MYTFWQKLQRWSQVVGDFQARLILTLLYAILVLPTGLIARIGGGLLNLRADNASTYWQNRPHTDSSLPRARGQG
ncbi:MAG: hypothetical protein KJZ86_24290 [Caldilineaceae bacterium]|nr:hypothetical protein [Caldilineaceae bacterium]